jgi:uncharacterized protein YbcI
MATDGTIPKDPALPANGAPRSSSLRARISRGIVHIISEHTGRGPTRARTTIDGSFVACLLEDSLTKGERSLVDRGKNEAVLNLRHSYQAAMEADLVALVEELTGRKVIAFMSTNHTAPDYGIEAFVLDGDVMEHAE